MSGGRGTGRSERLCEEAKGSASMEHPGDASEQVDASF